MLVPKNDMKIFVALEPVDMRKSINGLAVEIIEVLDGKPQSGDLYIFHNRASSLIKALFWDIDGFVLIYKRLEEHKFKFPKISTMQTLSISHKQLRWLLSGFDFARIDKETAVRFEDYF
ncbi:MAG: IS66 family insertion sequence element accessory protein TnpB [Rickettsiaceae bacterium]|nr:IS66 family insertion sequence element accessory protein TnpB [Rickettsiaceae bacterium]